VYAINSKIFFLNILLLWGVILDLDKYIFPWQTCFLRGGHLRLELLCIFVNMAPFMGVDITFIPRLHYNWSRRTYIDTMLTFFFIPYSSIQSLQSQMWLRKHYLCWYSATTKILEWKDQMF